MNAWRVAALSVPLAMCGCGAGEAEPGPGHGRVGTEGGRVEGPDGTAIVVPAGALDAPADLWVEPLDAALADVPFLAIGPAFSFGPDGMKFAKYVTVSVPFEAARIPTGRGLPDVRVWSSSKPGEWLALATNQPAPGADVVLAGTDHFSVMVAGVSPVGRGSLSPAATY